MIKKLCQELLHGQDGAAMLIVLSFMALSIPMVTGMLSFAGTLSKDSQTKTKVLQSQYASQGCTQHATYRLNNEANYADNMVIGTPDVYAFDGCTITVTKISVVVSSANAYADVVLALDVSGSVSAAELVFLKQAANDIVDAFDLENTEGRIRIGMLRFRGSSESVVGMTDVDLHGASEPLHNGINGLVQGGPGLASGTNLVAALNASGPQFATGLGDRVDPPYPVPNLLIVITDGNDSAGNSDSDIQNASIATGAEVFAVGVGSGIDTDTINAIASDPDIDHAFTAINYVALLGIINDIFAAVYAAAGIGTTFTIQSVSPDGTVNVSTVLLPPE